MNNGLIMWFTNTLSQFMTIRGYASVLWDRLYPPTSLIRDAEVDVRGENNRNTEDRSTKEFRRKGKEDGFS